MDGGCRLAESTHHPLPLFSISTQSDSDDRKGSVGLRCRAESLKYYQLQKSIRSGTIAIYLLNLNNDNR